MDRKQIVKALEEHFEVKAKYLGVPSFSYQIESGEKTYTVDREGKIWTAQGEEVEFEQLIKEPDEKQEQPEVAELAMQEEPVTVEVILPMEGHSGRSLRNLVNMVYSKQAIIKKAFEIEETIVEDDFAIRFNEVRVEDIEEFQTVLDDVGQKGCPGIEFNFYESTITFKFLKDPADPDKTRAYTQFVDMLNENAKAQKYASAKVKTTDNDKYAMRTWLLRLGMIGEEYKMTRKVLLSNLSGNGAFRKPAAADKEQTGE